VLNGFWIVQYEGVAGNGGGVAVFLNGNVYGGDTGYLYQGRVSQDGVHVQARISVKNFLPELNSVLGTTDDFELLVDGTLTENVISGQASVVGQNIMGIIVRMTRVSDIKS